MGFCFCPLLSAGTASGVQSRESDRIVNLILLGKLYGSKQKKNAITSDSRQESI